MSRARLHTLFGLVLLGLALAFVFARVLNLRFSSGDVYPHYSTQRSDPLGARALLESLDALEGIDARRNRADLMTIRSLDGDTALWLCGLSRRAFENMRGPDDSPVLRAVHDDGARLIVTLNPGYVPARFDLKEDEEEDDWWKRREELKRQRREAIEKAEKEKAKARRDQESGTEKPEETEAAEKNLKAEKETEAETETEPKPKPKPKPETAESGEAKTRPKKTGTVKKRAKDDKGEDDKGEDKKDDEEKKIEEEAREMFGPLLTEIWEIELSDPESFERPEGGWEVARGESLAPESLPETLPNWHSQYRFVPGSDAWKIAATVGGKPVAIERPLGKGTLVVTTDTFFASNEALWSEADPAFLLWLTGGKSRVVFDETIHGTVESGGTVLLLRRYRLHGLLVGILVFVALLAWKSASSLAPGSEEIERGLSGGGEAVSGEESVSGFVRLLRRSIPPKRLLAQCLAAYRESSPGRESRRQAEAADRLLASHETSPSTLKAADAYARIAAVLADRDAR